MTDVPAQRCIVQWERKGVRCESHQQEMELS